MPTSQITQSVHLVLHIQLSCSQESQFFKNHRLEKVEKNFIIDVIF